ncbi:ROK family protein [Flammeovirga aprica]|uniref:ROK family protein n=1 Tax=Flammeovirga aprica JL-4 TaxID=694437 RepID=A0A7X9RS93_9BACT|nr:ROK family protein [Flammeovirga aprica]NME68688.1 ROK family protein [Flammeovirga aprica JL-4]
MKKFILTADIGGSHITSSVVDFTTLKTIENTTSTVKVDSHASAEKIITEWTSALSESIEKFDGVIEGIALSMPGPFDYKNGICEITGLGKYENLFGYNIRLVLFDKYNSFITDPSKIIFLNDADAFILGAVRMQNYQNEKVIGLTLGTGYGSGFVENGQLLTEDSRVPEGGLMYCQPFKEGIAEDYISTRWFVKEWEKREGKKVKGVKEVSEADNITSKQLFDEFGNNLSATLKPWKETFQPTKMVIGGNITNVLSKFVKPLKNELNIEEIIAFSHTEKAAMIGAALHYQKESKIQMKNKGTL